MQTRLVGKLPSVERIRNPITTLGVQVGRGSSSSPREDVISKNKRTHVGAPYVEGKKGPRRRLLKGKAGGQAGRPMAEE